MQLRSNPFVVYELPWDAAPRGGSNRALPEVAQRVIDASLVLHHASGELSAELSSANGPNAMGRTRELLDIVHAIDALCELQANHNTASIPQTPEQQRRILAQDTVYSTAHSLLVTIARNNQFHADPLKVTQRRRWNALDRKSSGLVTLMQGDTVRVSWASPEAGNRTIELGAWVDALVDSDVDDEVKIFVLRQLAWSMSLASQVAAKTPRIRLLATSAREALERGRESPSVMGRVLDALKGAASVAGAFDSGRQLAIELAHVTAAFHLVHLAGQRTERVARMRSLLHHFSRWSVLEDEGAARLRSIFDALGERAQAGAGASLTLQEAGQVRDIFPVGDLDHHAFGRAMAALNLITFGISVKEFGENREQRQTGSTLAQVASWGTLVHGVASAGDSLFTLFATERAGDALIKASQAAASRQLTALGRIFRGSSAMGILGAATSMISGMADIQGGREEHDDTRVVFGTIAIALAFLEILTIAFPALAPVTVVAGIAVAVAAYMIEEQERLLPFNLRYLKSLCRKALELKGADEGPGDAATIAARLGIRDGLFRLMNDVAPGTVNPEIYWRPLLVGVDHRPIHDLPAVFGGESFEQFVQQRLGRWLGRTRMGTGSIPTLLRGE